VANLNFPTDPDDGDTYLDYVFSNATQTWNLIESIFLADIGNVNISSAEAKDVLIYESENNNWSSQSGNVVPTGAIFPYTSTIIPPGYMACNGQVLLQSEYSNLYGVIGLSYNVGGEPSGTFRLPSLTSRIPVGLNSGESEFSPLGKYGGSEKHLLSINELATHTHTQDAHTHTQNAHNHTQSSHSHSATAGFGAPGGSVGYGFYGAFRNRVGITGGWGLGTDSRTPTIQGRVAINQSTVAQNLSTGGFEPHNNLQPYIVLNYMIKV